MDSKIIEKFQRNLLNWYDDNARILPWREEPSPYRVWISEIMLQQTRVDTVVPYFQHFMEEVPTISDLANIGEDKLLKLWEGLGYYSRAMNLKKAAKVVMEEYDGKMPVNREALQTLPGIGPYSSGAIASIAYGQRVPAVDGNVLRVLARITANEGDISDPKVKKEIEELVVEALPKERVGDFNQALMELGATVCLPNGAPKCDACPVRSICEAQKCGLTERIPVKSPKKERKVEQRTVLVMEDSKGRIAIRQRPKQGLLRNLWEFPNEAGHLSLEELNEILRKWGITIRDTSVLKPSKHLFTHREWHLIGYFIRVENDDPKKELIWATREEIKDTYPIPTAFKEYLNFLFRGA